MPEERIHWSKGSTWLRWDPHLHTPGTLRNNQFGNNWDAYIAKVEAANPAVVALGITDYFCLRGYKEIMRRKKAGALKTIPLIFANIELRLTIETDKKKPINFHLLISPDDPAHVEIIEDKLGSLVFHYDGQDYPCKESALIRLGRTYHNDPSLPELIALSEGANQFKVEQSSLIRLKNDDWVRKNVLFAVAAGNDGLSGLGKDASFKAQREELSRLADIIFSAQPSDREFWLGHHPNFTSLGYKPKPCLHGSDAHKLDDVLQPEDNRYCWIRSEPTFEGLRQTLAEPERRVYLGVTPPVGPSASLMIQTIKIENASWFPAEILDLNDGLVTIIGARGSGKTALADLVAAGASAVEEEPGPASFLAKAGDLLDGSTVKLTWGDGRSDSMPLSASFQTEPMVRYLSQQFVERLCSGNDPGKPLVEEMERIVFEATLPEEQMEASSFGQLREFSTAWLRADQEDAREEIRQGTLQIARETALKGTKTTVENKLGEVSRELTSLDTDFKKLPKPADDTKRIALESVERQLATLQQSIAQSRRQTELIQEFRSSVSTFRRNANTTYDAWKSKYSTLLSATDWAAFVPCFRGEIDPIFARLQKDIEDRIKNLETQGQSPVSGEYVVPADRGLVVLKAQSEKLTREMGLDLTNARKRTDLLRKQGEAQLSQQRLKAVLDNIKSADVRISNENGRRLAAYEKLFTALDGEIEVLKKLYEPLRKRLSNEPLLQKLSFNIRRSLNLTSWVERGEALIDLRRDSPFQGQGTLSKLATAELLPAWLTGTPGAARNAMEQFVQKHAKQANAARAEGVSPSDFGEWLFSTDHIQVEYGLLYEGVELSRLSPGSRGVVLLTLYLGVDEWDRRPLVIDQPEENLDPQSVYDQLVQFFRGAAQRRQVILVTHNANLVVNADADQVIVAKSHRDSAIGLPRFTYTAGGLEDNSIRTGVCNLLEGGREAFERRRQRYGDKVK